MTVGDRIRIKREELKISQKELADRLKTTKQAIYKYEMNIVTNIPSDKIEEMAKILECSPSYLMGWERDPEVKTDTSVSKGKQVIKNESMEKDSRLQKIIDFYNNMTEDGRNFLLTQAEVCYRQFATPSEKDTGILAV